jgi:hypothetical protein
MGDLEEAKWDNRITAGEEIKAEPKPRAYTWNIVDFSVGKGKDKTRILSSIAVSGQDNLSGMSNRVPLPSLWLPLSGSRWDRRAHGNFGTFW